MKITQNDKHLKERTASSFGYEWTKFGDIFPEYEENFLSYIFPITKEFFNGKLVLDAGCGAGRHSYFAAKYGAGVVAFDISSRAVDAAAKNLEGLPGTLAVQADIYDLPTNWNNRFDYVISIGVIHHLPDPQDGFRRLIKTIKPGGAISIWVYGRKDNRLAMYLFEPLRRVSTLLPHRLLYVLSFVGAVVLDTINRLKVPIFKNYTCFPFKTKWNDVFDVFSVPSAKYYTTDDIQGWFKQAGLKDIQVSCRILNGKVKGIRGLGVK